MKRLLHRKRNKALAIFFCINLFLGSLLYTNLFTFPNTFIGSVNVSGKTAGQLTELLKNATNEFPSMQVKNRTYTYSYDQMGIIVDTQKAVDDAFRPNRAWFPLNIAKGILSLFFPHSIAPPLVFTQEYDQFVADTMFDFSPLPDALTIDQMTKSILVTENTEAYRFDKRSLSSLLISHFGGYAKPMYPMLAKVTNETITQVADTNDRLQQVFNAPIIVYIDLGGNTQAVELKEEDVRAVTTVSLDTTLKTATIQVNPEILNTTLIKKIRSSGFPIRDQLVTPQVVADFERVIDLRFGGTPVSAVATTTDVGPNTNGSLAPKYIEVDISQQKMYLFKDGRMIKKYTVSTGSDYPTPTGQFAIINKTGLGYSTIYQNWLPWWMGFSFSSELNAYFGIHEQPYVLTEDGKRLSAGPAALGTPSTGGCVALAPGAAREVYAFADIGTPVYIYN